MDNSQWLQAAINPPPATYLLLGGADAIAVYAFAKQLGWMVSIWDSRAANAKRQYFQNADAIFTNSSC
ncbi:hypothetical protein ACOBV9_20355 (plasmid) [Pseudoalteromonas espejiana]